MFRTASLHYFLILLLAFTAGFIIMSIELLGGRILAPYFGSSVYVWGSIITVFMLSLSLGYLIGGRLSMHAPSLKKHGLFFILAALMLLPLILWGETLMETVFLSMEDPRYGSLIVSLLLFFIPTTILGMVSPYSVRLLVMNHLYSGQIAGFLYFISTLGSALGTLGTSFYFVLWFEVNTLLTLMMGVLLLAGTLAILSHFMISEPDETASNRVTE